MIVRAALTAASWGCSSALDVGSGQGKYRALVGHCATLDAYQHAPMSDHHRIGNALEVLPWVDAGSYDLVYALDVVEHFTREDGLALLDHLVRIARVRVLVFTPCGFMEQKDAVHWQDHRSGWTADDLRALGFWTAVVDFDYGKGTRPGAALWGVREAP
jgi:hypothetical protein